MKKYLKTFAAAVLIAMSVQTAAEAAGWAAMRWAYCNQHPSYVVCR